MSALTDTDEPGGEPDISERSIVRVRRRTSPVLINNAPPAPGSIQPRRPYQTITFLPGTSFAGDNPENFAIAGDTTRVSAINYLENTANSWYDAGWVDV